MERDSFNPFAENGDDQQSQSWDPKAVGAVDWTAAKPKTTADWDTSFDFHHEKDIGPFSALNTSIESSIFDFAVVDEAASHVSDVALLSGDVFACKDREKESPGSSVVQVAIHEQLTSLQDDGVVVPLCQIEGSIHVRLFMGFVWLNYMFSSTIILCYVDDLDFVVLLPFSPTKYVLQIRSSNNAQFCLVVRDENGFIADLTPDLRFCKDITPGKNNGFIDTGITVLRVTPPLEAPSQRKILSFKCNYKLRPIPLVSSYLNEEMHIFLFNMFTYNNNNNNMHLNLDQQLIKTKVQIAKKDCRVGIKIRSNPENQHCLTQVAIIVAIPPDVDGRSVRLSRAGGVWDSMKRVLAWSVDQLGPGELIEIQAQFAFESGAKPADRSPKFPVLVRCDAQKEHFSKIELSSNFADQLSSPAKISVVSSVRIMHRKP